MKTLATFAAVLALLSGSAFAGVLPITGQYCDDHSRPSDDLKVDANGVWGEEDLPFGEIVKSGPNWWVVAYKGEIGDGGDRVEISPDRQTIKLTMRGDPQPYTLHRCD